MYHIQIFAFNIKPYFKISRAQVAIVLVHRQGQLAPALVTPQLPSTAAVRQAGYRITTMPPAIVVTLLIECVL